MQPTIYVHSKDADPKFSWESDFHGSKTEVAKTLMAIAHKHIEAGKNVLDTITRLKNAGFLVMRPK